VKEYRNNKNIVLPKKLPYYLEPAYVDNLGKVEDEDVKADISNFHSRVMDVGLETLNVLSPVRGVMETVLVPIELAIEKTGLPDMRAFVYTAKMKAESNLNGDPRGLTVDERAAIYLYTYESPLYRKLNELLRKEDRNFLKPFFFLPTHSTPSFTENQTC